MNYSITKLEPLGLCVNNINKFKHLLTKVDFDCTVDHLALTYIMKSKTGQTRSGAQNKGITVGKIHEHDKSLLPHLKPEKTAKILSQLLSKTASPNQPQIPTNVPITRRERTAGLRRKVPGTNPLLTPEVFHNLLRLRGQHYLLKIYKFIVPIE